MKKTAVFVVSALFLFQSGGVALAMQHGSPEYQKMVAIKKAQREKKKNPAASEQSFFQKEASRSGLAGTAAMFGNAIGGAIPMTNKPNSGKENK